MCERLKKGQNRVYSIGNIVAIETSQGEYIFIDSKDIWLTQFTWCVNDNGYAVTNLSEDKLEYMHRMILKPRKGYVTDHINGDKLNNMRSNLREVTQSQNLMNSKIPTSNTSGVKGVIKIGNRWRAVIKLNKKQIHLGCFATLEEAAAARKAAEDKYFGIYAHKENQ